MTRMLAVALVALALGCANGRWKAAAADQPLNRAELASRQLSIQPLVAADEPALGEHGSLLRTALIQALADAGFHLVEHPPYKGELELTLGLVRTAGSTDPGQPASVAVATLRSDGFYVSLAEQPTSADELLDPARRRAIAEGLAGTLAATQGLADFVRHSGVPSQSPVTR